jgi:protein required for attachment to host cells
MAKRSPQSFVKRQREMDKKRKAEEKRQRRQDRATAPEDAEQPEEEFMIPPPIPLDQEEIIALRAKKNSHG